MGLADSLIETYICKLVVDANEIQVSLLNHISSPFMGNIEMLINLHQSINLFESSQLDIELAKISDKHTRSKIVNIIKQFIYLLLNHSLKLIYVLVETIKNNPEKKSVCESLLKHSIIIENKITKFVKDELDKKIKEYKALQDDVVRMGSIKVDLFEKVSKLEKSVFDQNLEIKKILTSLPNNIIESQVLSTESASSTEKLENQEEENDDNGDSNYYFDGSDMENIKKITISAHDQQNSQNIQHSQNNLFDNQEYSTKSNKYLSEKSLNPNLFPIK